MRRELLRAFVAQAEGRRSRCYRDSLGIATIGVGINLEEPRNIARLERLGHASADVIQGLVTLSDSELDALLDEDLELAMADARAVVSNFDELDHARQIVLVDMAFNLGRTRLAGFRRMCAALESRDFAAAASEMQDSIWYRQVRSRGERNVEAMRSGVLPAALQS